MTGDVVRLVCRNDPGHARWVDADLTVAGMAVMVWWTTVADQRCKACRERVAATPDPPRQPSPVEARKLASNAGPRSSQVAAALVAPKAGTRKANVLAALRAAAGAWVPGEQIATPACGGSEGLKRLRELRQDGFAVDERPPPGGDGMWWYRLVEDGEVGDPGLFGA